MNFELVSNTMTSNKTCQHEKRTRKNSFCYKGSQSQLCFIQLWVRRHAWLFLYFTVSICAFYNISKRMRSEDNVYTRFTLTIFIIILSVKCKTYLFAPYSKITIAYSVYLVCFSIFTEVYYFFLRKTKTKNYREISVKSTTRSISHKRIS